jgi:hypothetical protein
MRDYEDLTELHTELGESKDCDVSTLLRLAADLDWQYYLKIRTPILRIRDGW